MQTTLKMQRTWAISLSLIQRDSRLISLPNFAKNSAPFGRCAAWYSSSRTQWILYLHLQKQWEWTKERKEERKKESSGEVVKREQNTFVIPLSRLAGVGFAYKRRGARASRRSRQMLTLWITLSFPSAPLFPSNNLPLESILPIRSAIYHIPWFVIYLPTFLLYRLFARDSLE